LIILEVNSGWDLGWMADMQATRAKGGEEEEEHEEEE